MFEDKNGRLLSIYILCNINCLRSYLFLAFTRETTFLQEGVPIEEEIPFLPKAKTRSNSLKDKETILKTIHCHKIKFVQEGGYATYFLEIQKLL